MYQLFLITILSLLTSLSFSAAQAALPTASDQFLQSLSQSNSGMAPPGEAHTLEYTERFKNNPWISQFNDNIINGEDVTPELREKGQAMIDKVEELDKRCAATPNGPAQEACTQQRNAAISQLEKMVADNNPDLNILLNQQAAEAGDFSSEFDPSNLVQQFDGNFAQSGNLMDMAGSLGSMPQTETKEALETPMPAGPSTDITQQLNLGDNLQHKRLAETQTGAVSEEQSEGFFDKIQNFWERLKPGVGQAFSLQVFAQSPFSTLGQSGQSQLRVISSSRATDSFDRQSKAVNDERDRRVTQHNDINGQGLSAINERVTKNMESMNEITKEQDKGLQSLQHICQSQRKSVPCWESGNEIPFDLLALLMGLTGGGNESPEIDLPTLEPYTAWLHCPLPDQSFTRVSEGTSTTALFMSESQGTLLTLKSALPSPMHENGCIVALDSEAGWQYLTAQVKADASTNENRVEADLTLLQIEGVHTEAGIDLADLETPYDDFITQYWPGYTNVCLTDPVFRIGDDLNLYGFEPLEIESEEPEAVAVLNGLANFVAEENGATRFTTNGEETFYGGLVTRTENGCFKGLAKIEIDREEESNDQSLIPVLLIQQWLASQNVVLPLPETNEPGR